MSFAAATFYDEKRAECWWRCEKPSQPCRITTCPDADRCYGTKIKDSTDCHFFKYCYRDKYSGPDNVECR